MYAGGQFNYGNGSGGIFRSDDGGQTWRDLGWDQHPDFHAFAFDPNNSNQILSGSDGGVWYSDESRRPPGRRAIRSTPSTWQNLNGIGVDGAAGTAACRSAQFTSIATMPTVARTFLGRHAGQRHDAQVDGANDAGRTSPAATAARCSSTRRDANFVYGTYFGISPYRFTDGGSLLQQQYIRSGINLGDRSEFYIPMAMNKEQPEPAVPRDVPALPHRQREGADRRGTSLWKPISPDLTAGAPAPRRTARAAA